MPNLFRLGDFTLHSGQRAHFKIDCEALTVNDWECLAHMAHRRIGYLPSEVIGVPRGGLKFAEACNRRFDGYWSSSPRRLIVDDVLTTGASILELMRPGDHGLVVFARGPCPPNVRALFQMGV